MILTLMYRYPHLLASETITGHVVPVKLLPGGTMLAESALPMTPRLQQPVFLAGTLPSSTKQLHSISDFRMFRSIAVAGAQETMEGRWMLRNISLGRLS